MMNQTHRTLLFLFAVLFPLSFTAVNAQTTSFNPGVTANGVTYALPRTVLRADVAAIKTQYTPGEFARYAERYLHVQNVGQEPHTEYAVQQLALNLEGTPDTLKTFTIRLKDKTVAPMVALTESGIILGVNGGERVQEDAAIDPIYRTGRTTHHQLDSRSYFTEEILAATSSAKMAELTAAEIYDIRETRNLLVRGQLDAMPNDGEAMRLVLDRLNAQESALVQLFIGYTDTTWISESYRIEPHDYEDVPRSVLFRFSRKLGFVDADDLSGEPYYIEVKDQHSVVLPSEKELAKRKIEGIVYNLPSQAQVVVWQGSRELLSRTFPVAQYGTIDQLAPALFGKDATTRVTFHPATGGLLHLQQ